MLRIWTNGVDSVIAESVEDALAIVSEHHGYSSVQEYAHDFALQDGPFVAWQHDKPFRFHQDSDEHAGEARLPHVWCRLLGRCFLASTEW